MISYMTLHPFMKPPSGIGKGGLSVASRQMKADAKRGVISMNVSRGVSKVYVNRFYELIDENYPMLEGYRYQDLGIGGYNYYYKNEAGKWIRVNNWHEPYLEGLTSESAKRGFVKLQIYGDAGRVEY